MPVSSAYTKTDSDNALTRPMRSPSRPNNTPPSVQGGYILKVDRLDNGDVGITAGSRVFAWVDPREFTSYPTHLAVATAAPITATPTAAGSTCGGR